MHSGQGDLLTIRGAGHGTSTDAHAVIAIIVNGQRKTVREKHISYSDLVRLAYPHLDPRAVYTVTYDNGPRQNREGSMSAGDTVKIRDGMVFHVLATSKS
jgi:Multiubiquitin